MKKMITSNDKITLREYCPKTPYGRTIQDILRRVVEKEDQINHATITTWKPLKFDIPAHQKPYKSPGWRNFYKSLLP